MAGQTSKSSLVRHASPDKKYSAVVVFVPFYKAKPSSLKKHIEFVTELGFDAVTFHLQDHFNGWNSPLFSSSNQVGLRHVWADQIEHLLNQIPEKKIIFSFSNPCSASIESIARRKASDVLGLVCDSGPSGNLYRSILNYYTYEEPISLFPIRLAIAASAALAWSPPSVGRQLEDDLKQIPAGFRILSIRGWKDKLISPQDIDQVFEPHPHLNWRKLSLPKADHLNGLKNFSQEYQPAVATFLQECAST